MSRYLRTYSRVRAISNKSNESNEYERTRIKVRSFVANGYSLRIVSCSEDSFDSRPCSLIIYSNSLKFGRFVRCPSLPVTQISFPEIQSQGIRFYSQHNCCRSQRRRCYE